MRISKAFALTILLLASQAALAEPLDFASNRAFGIADPSLNTADLAKFNYGRGLFHHEFQPFEHADGTQSGLGPLFNANSCAACHIRDGRGHPPEDGDATSFVMQLARPRVDDDNLIVALPDPTYGAQIQDRAIAPLQPEAVITVFYDPYVVTLTDGTEITLRRPLYAYSKPAYGTFADDTGSGPRVAPQLIGLGQLESVSAEALIALADPDDADGDGISGEVNLRRGADGEMILGRFGWKATTPSVAAQSDIAARVDMGLSVYSAGEQTSDCTAQQSACAEHPFAAPVNAAFELDANDSFLLAFYAANLAVPPRRNPDAPNVLAGEALFSRVGCAACHLPALPGAKGPVAAYTDLLLHDMGPDLADGISIGHASEREWRTPPLWGIGLTQQVSGHTFFLHDGRARDLQETILWHGGEAQKTRDAYVALSVTDRNNLLDFLNSL